MLTYYLKLSQRTRKVGNADRLALFVKVLDQCSLVVKGYLLYL